jgi:hypothetical protein
VFTDAQKNAARLKLNANDNTLVVLFMGRLSFHAKAHPLAMYQALQMAAHKLKAAGKKIKLVECGWHANEFIEKAYRDAALHACPDVEVITLDGRKAKDRETAWAGADVFCSLSDNIQETFGIVPIEAMAAGLPVVVSDWDGVDQVHADRVTAVAQAVNAGVDIIMVSADWRGMLAALDEAITRALIPMSRIDDAVRRILWVKEQAGLFERPRPAQRPAVIAHATAPIVGSTAHRAVAREAVRKSCVLLAHDGETLPLARGQRILVAGRLADDRGAQCGGFTIAWQGVRGNDAIAGGASVWEAIRAVAPHAEWSADGSLADAARHDVAVVVIGEHPYAEGQGDIRGARVASGAALGLPCAELVPYGDTLELHARHPEDLATIERIAALGIPVVTVLVSGRPVVAEQEMAASSAFVAAWLPGSEAQGVADLLFGDEDFQGRLPFAWPERMGADATAMGCRFPRGYGLTLAATTGDASRLASSSRRTDDARASVIG